MNSGGHKQNPQRRDVELRRRREKEDERARIVALAKAAEEERQVNFMSDVRRFERRRSTGWVFLGLSATMFVGHSPSHLDWFRPFDQSLQDALIGYPTGAILLLVAVFLLGQVHPAERK